MHGEMHRRNRSVNVRATSMQSKCPNLKAKILAELKVDENFN
jgi:hypothetical protein